MSVCSAQTKVCSLDFEECLNCAPRNKNNTTLLTPMYNETAVRAFKQSLAALQREFQTLFERFVCLDEEVFDKVLFDHLKLLRLLVDQLSDEYSELDKLTFLLDLLPMANNLNFHPFNDAMNEMVESDILYCPMLKDQVIRDVICNRIKEEHWRLDESSNQYSHFQPTSTCVCAGSVHHATCLHFC